MKKYIHFWVYILLVSAAFSVEAFNSAITSSGSPCQLAQIAFLSEELSRRGHQVHVIVPSGAQARCENALLYRARCHEIDCCNIHMEGSQDRQMLNALVIESSLHVIVAASRAVKVRRAAQLLSVPFVELIMDCPSSEDGHLKEGDVEDDHAGTYASTHHIIDARVHHRPHARALCPNVHLVGALERSVVHGVYGQSRRDARSTDSSCSGGRVHENRWYIHSTDDVNDNGVFPLHGTHRAADVIELAQRLGIANTDFWCHDRPRAFLSSSLNYVVNRVLSAAVKVLVGFTSVLAAHYIAEFTKNAIY